MTLPQVPETFYWTREGWGAALRCRPLDAIAPHLFTTRQLELPSQSAFQQLSRATGTERDRFVTLAQVHGCRVVCIRKGADPTSLAAMQRTRPEADAMISDDPSIGLVIRAADCVPLLMADRRGGVVAAVHAGWRGTAARVGPATVAALGDAFGSRPADLVAAIGPSIGPCCYEVGSDVVDAFAAAGHERHLVERWFTVTPPRLGTFSPVPGAPDRTRISLDVPGSNRDQLVLAGLSDENIHTANLCTAMHLDLLTSYRVEREGAGRIAGVIRAANT